MGLLSAMRRRLAADLDSRLAPRFHAIFDETPVTTYDIGAAGGVFTPYTDGPSSWAPVIGFEPHPESYRLIAEAGLPEHISLYNFALSDADGPVEFHAGEGRARTRSSLRSIDYTGARNTLVTVDARTLDSLPQVLGIPPADFVKLDTEGSEDLVLNGGINMFRQDVLGILVEVAFWTDQSGGVAFRDLDRMLTEQGFVLFDLQINRSDKRAIGGRKDKVRSGDALYLRNFTSVAAASTDPASLKIKLLKLISLSVAWKYLNYALELADYGRTLELLTAQEFSDIAQPLIATVDLSDRVPSFPGRMLLATIFETLAYALHPSIKKGVPYSFNGLGNHWVVRRRSKSPTTVELYCPIIEPERNNRSKFIVIERTSGPS